MPPGAGATQRDVSGYIVDLHQAWQNCHDTVGALGRAVK